MAAWLVRGPEVQLTQCHRVNDTRAMKSEWGGGHLHAHAAHDLIVAGLCLASYLARELGCACGVAVLIRGGFSDCNTYLTVLVGILEQDLQLPV
jgi:hypothetical protein